MKHYTDIIVHGARLVRHLMSEQVPAGGKLVTSAKLPLAAARTAARALGRKMIVAEEGDEDDFLSSLMLGGDQSAFGGGFDEPAGGGLSDLGFGEDADLEQFMEIFEQCGIDIEEMSSKALGAYLLYGSDIDPSHPDLEAYSSMLLALKDDDEENCSDDELPAITSAFEEYAKCSGMSDFFDFDELESSTLLESIEDACKPVFDLFASGDLLAIEEGLEDEESAFNKSGKVCLQTLLGDNAIGNFVRYQWDHLDKTLECFSALSEDLPHCVISSPIQEEGGDSVSVSVPMSLEKKMACVLGASSEIFIEELCTEIYEYFEACIPSNLGEDHTVATCGEDDFLLGMDMSVLSGNKIPSFCSKVFQEKDGEELLQKYDMYNAQREYGWTIEKDKQIDTAITKEEGTEHDTKEDPSPPEDESKAKDSVSEAQAVYESNPDDLASVESVNWGDGEAEEAVPSDINAKFFPFLVAGMVVLGAAAVGLFVKYRWHGTTAQASQSRNNYSSDLKLVVEQPDIV